MSIPYDEFTSEIINVLTKRDFIFQRTTNLIAKKIDFVFEAIIEYLNENAHEIEWESIEISNDLLVIVAKIPNQINRRILSVGIPLSIIQHQSKDKIIQFFEETEKERVSRENDLADMINDVLDQYGTDIKVASSYESDVDPLYDSEDNDVMPKRYIPPKRTLH